MGSGRVKGRETFKALAEGKTVYFPIRNMRFKMDSDGNLLVRTKSCDNWEVCGAVCGWVWMDECEIAKEYPLSFKDAVNEAMHGKRVANEYLPELQYHFDKDGQLMCDGEVEKIYAEEIKAKWKVVE